MHSSAAPSTPKAQQQAYQQSHSPWTAPATYQRPDSPLSSTRVVRLRVDSTPLHEDAQQRLQLQPPQQSPQMHMRRPVVDGPADQEQVFVVRKDVPSADGPRRFLPQPMQQQQPAMAC